MGNTVVISLDAMGGDYGTSACLEAANRSLERSEPLRFLLHGDSDTLKRGLDRFSKLRAVSEVRHADIALEMHEQPSQALRRGRGNSSMWRAAKSVRKKEADILISAGNTGALMAISKIVIGTMEGVHRPALAAILPTQRQDIIFLDVGAVLKSSEKTLVQNAIMGVAYARAALGIDSPTVGLLNVGEEEMKGTKALQLAFEEIGKTEIASQFKGFVEGGDLLKGVVDVVVTDGFTGNIALKTAEGTAKMIFGLTRRFTNRSFFTRAGGVLMRPALSSLMNHIYTPEKKGALFLGLQGLSMKCHGDTGPIPFSYAIDFGARIVRSLLQESIAMNIKVVPESVSQEASSFLGGVAKQ